MKATPQEISQWIIEGLSGRTIREPRWQRNRANYYNDPQSPAGKPYESGADVHLPLVQPVGDDLCSMVTSTITSGNPYMVAGVFDVGDDDDVAGKLEKTLQFFAETSGLRDALRRVAVTAFWSNVGWIKTEWIPGALPRFSYRCMEPFQCVVYPDWSPSLELSRAHGECVVRRVDEIEHLMKVGWYKKTDIAPSDSEVASTALAEASSAGKPAESNDKKVELWDIICKDGDKRYRKIIDPKTSTVYKEEDWTAPASRYAEFAFKPRADLDGYWPASSVAQDLQELQAHGSSIFSTFVHGAQMSVYGAAFMGKGVTTPKAAVRFGPGEVIEGNVENMQIFAPKPDLGALPLALSQIMTLARQVARVSLNAAGNGDQALGTATEAMIAQQGQQNVTDDYVATFGAGVRTVYEYMQHVLFETWDQWFPIYGQKLGLEEGDRALFGAPVLWRLNVDSLGASPQAQFASAMQLMQIAAVQGSGIDIYELASRMVDAADRSGFTNAKDLQIPRGPDELLDYVAAAYSVDVEVLENALIAALEADPGQMGGMEAQPLAPGLAGGLGGQTGGMPGTDGGVQSGGSAPVAGAGPSF